MKLYALIRFDFLFQPKISLFSPFERVNDRRTLAERREMFNGKQIVEDVKEKPKSKFDDPSENKSAKKPKKKKDVQEDGEQPAVEETPDESALVNDEQPAEEQPEE
jgi:hypothetical protein